MDLRKAQLHLLKMERTLVNAAAGTAGGKVSAPVKARLSRELAACAAAAGAVGFAVPAAAEEAAGRIAALPETADGGAALVSLARFVTEAHASFEQAAIAVGARLLPLAEGLPKKPPLAEVQQFLGLIS